MILGIGKDIVDISRIEKALETHGERFVQRCFTAEEQDEAGSKTDDKSRVESFAKRYAAKEALSKALGSGIAHGVFMKDLMVSKDQYGRPIMTVAGGAKDWLDKITPAGHVAKIHTTLTDEPPYAEALVIIEALPE